jgi:hypothetical protein
MPPHSKAPSAQGRAGRVMRWTYYAFLPPRDCAAHNRRGIPMKRAVPILPCLIAVALALSAAPRQAPQKGSAKIARVRTVTTGIAIENRAYEMTSFAHPFMVNTKVMQLPSR